MLALILPFVRKPAYALPPVIFFLLGFLRMYSILGTGTALKDGKGWYAVSIYDWGRGRVLYTYVKGKAIKVRSGEVTVLAGGRPVFPRDEVLVRGEVRGDTLEVWEAYYKRGTRWFYEGLSRMLLDRTLSEDQYNFALSVFTGVKGLRWEVKRAFYETGTGHVLAISGLHVGILFLAVALLLRFVLPGTYVPLVASAFVWAYAYAVGFLPSVVRAATMLTLFSLASLLSRPVKPLNVLAVSLLLSLLFRPLWVFSPSLWLSYSAVAGLFSLRGKLGAVFGASLFSLPFALKYFGKYALLYVPLNLLVVPLMTAFMYAQLLALLLPYPFTHSAALLYDLLEGTIVRAASLHLPALHYSIGWPAVLGYVLLLSTLLLCRRFVGAKGKAEERLTALQNTAGGER